MLALADNSFNPSLVTIYLVDTRKFLTQKLSVLNEDKIKEN